MLGKPRAWRRPAGAINSMEYINVENCLFAQLIQLCGVCKLKAECIRIREWRWMLSILFQWGRYLHAVWLYDDLIVLIISYVSDGWSRQEWIVIAILPVPVERSGSSYDRVPEQWSVMIMQLILLTCLCVCVCVVSRVVYRQSIEKPCKSDNLVNMCFVYIFFQRYLSIRFQNSNRFTNYEFFISRCQMDDEQRSTNWTTRHCLRPSWINLLFVVVVWCCWVYSHGVNGVNMCALWVNMFFFVGRGWARGIFKHMNFCVVVEVIDNRKWALICWYHWIRLRRQQFIIFFFLVFADIECYGGMA